MGLLSKRAEVSFRPVMPINGCIFQATYSVSGLPFFLQPRGLASTLAQVVELCPTNFRPAYDLYLLNARGVQKKSALHANTVSRDAPHGEILVHAASAKANDGALKGLNALSLTFHDPQMDADGITGSKIW